MSPTVDGPLVLVAEDEPQLLRLVERLLLRAGYAVVSASDGDAAQQICAERGSEIRVAVLDAAIVPRGAGEIARAVAALQREVGLVLTSGEALDDPLRELLKSHDGVFLRKPFPPAALLRAVGESQILEVP